MLQLKAFKESVGADIKLYLVTNPLIVNRQTAIYIDVNSVANAAGMTLNQLTEVISYNASTQSAIALIMLENGKRVKGYDTNDLPMLYRLLMLRLNEAAIDGIRHSIETSMTVFGQKTFGEVK